LFCFFDFSCQYQCSQLPGKTRLQNDVLCVESDVKPTNSTQLKLSFAQHTDGILSACFLHLAFLLNTEISQCSCCCCCCGCSKQLHPHGQYWAGRTPPPNNRPPNMAAANFVVITNGEGCTLNGTAVAAVFIDQ